MCTTNKPKYKVDETVTLKSPTLFKEWEGKVVEVQRLFKRLNSAGKFDPHGLVTRESEIESIKLPYTLVDDVLTVTYPSDGPFGGRTEKSAFYGYAYTIKTPKMLSIYSESGLTKEPPPPIPIDNSPLVNCPACKGGGKISVSFTTFGSSKEPEISVMDCITCEGEGRVTANKAAAHQRVWSEENWCKCHNSGTRHKREGGQDYYYCTESTCGKLKQVG